MYCWVSFQAIKNAKLSGVIKNLCIFGVLNIISFMTVSAQQKVEPGLEKDLTLREEAFQQLLNKTVPLKPEQIIELHRHIDQSKQAVHAPINRPPTPVSSTLVVDLSPGNTPPVVRLSAGFVSSVVFVDATGESWPVADYSLGNSKDFNIQWDKKTNTLFLQSNEQYVTGNLAVRLADLNTPVMVSLVSGQKEIDYRVDLQIQARGPNAKHDFVVDYNSAAQKPFLLNFLDGVPPEGSEELELENQALGRAWLYNNKLLLRTKLTVLSPSWLSNISSVDGTKVYELQQTPLVLVSDQGATMHIRLKI